MDALRSPRGAAVAVGLLTLAGGLLRAATAGAQSLWLDELVTASLLRLGFGEMLDAIPTSERTPYLYYVLAWPVTRLLGDGEIGLRALSIVAGTLTIPVAYLAGRELASRRVALATAGLVAVNPLLVWYAQDARAYALLALLATTGLWLTARALARGDGLSLAGWAVVSSLAVATHYVALLVVVLEAALLLRRDLRRRTLAWSLLPLAVLVLHAPLLREQRGHSSAPISDEALSTRVLGVLKASVAGFGAPGELVLGIAAAALASFALVLVATRAPAEERRGALVAGLVAGGALALAVGVAVVGPDLVLARNLIAAVPALLVVLAVGFVATTLGRAAGVGLAALSLLVALAPVIDATHGRTDWRGAAEAIGSPPPGGRAIVVTPSITPDYWSPYLPGLEELEGSPRAVEEVVVVGLATEGGFGVGELRPPDAGTASPPAGFVRVESEERGTYTLVRYRAQRPTRVTAEELAALRLAGGTGRELLQAG